MNCTSPLCTRERCLTLYRYALLAQTAQLGIVPPSRPPARCFAASPSLGPSTSVAFEQHCSFKRYQNISTCWGHTAHSPCRDTPNNPKRATLQTPHQSPENTDTRFVLPVTLVRLRNVCLNGTFFPYAQGVSHWSVVDDRSLLFDRDASELDFLDVADGPLMRSIYHDNGSGWIKVSVVRDPVTRLLSAYLDVARTWQAGWHEYQQQKVRPGCSR